MPGTRFPRDVRLATLGRDMVRVPLKHYGFHFEAVNAINSTQMGGIEENTDGTSMGQYMSVTCMASPISAGKGARIVVPFSGRKFGIRVVGPTSAFKFDVIIDGEAFAVNLANNSYLANGVVWGGSYSNDQEVMIADDLADRLHIAEVVVVADKAGGATRTVIVLGWLLERRAGYRELVDSIAEVVHEATLTASQAQIFGGSGMRPRSLRAVKYYNKSASQRTVTIQVAGKDKYKIVLAATGTLGCSAEFPMYDCTAIATWTHAADAVDSVEATVEGTWN